MHFSKEPYLKEEQCTRPSVPGDPQRMENKKHITLATTYLLGRFQGRKLSAKQIYSEHKLFCYCGS